MMKTSLGVLVFLFIVIQCKKHCRTEHRVLSYSKLKSCHRSTLPVIFWANVEKVEECIQYAREKNGLAFNFSPLEARKYSKGIVIGCQVLGCPEIENSTTLIKDSDFDYYSAYGNWTATQNATCIKSIGLFVPLFQKENYTNSIDLCQKIGGELADITSEIRTKYISNIINETLDNWYKVAYVGLDDIEQEGHFISAFGVLLNCVTFRSWAPGHPISDTDNHNCVVLDDNKMWRVIACKRKMAVICELFPEKPVKRDLCQNISENAKKRKCIKRKQALDEIMKNLTRMEQCAIMNPEIIENQENVTQIHDHSES